MRTSPRDQFLDIDSMERTEKIHAHMLAAGLSSDLSRKAAKKGFTLSKLRRATAAELWQHFSMEEAAFIKERLQRSKIRADVVFRLLDESHGKCCICWDFSSDAPIIFHHIDEHSKSADDSYENLAVLCLNHHGQAHTRSGLSRSVLPPEIIRARKRDWIEAVADHRSGKRVAPGSELPTPHLPQPRAPAMGTDVLGRREPSDAIRVLVAKKGHSRVAICGMGGVGKTVLALQLANDLLPVFPGGVLWGSLGDYAGDSKALLTQWGRVCGAELPDVLNTPELADTLRNWLAEYSEKHGRLLVVLDDARVEWMEEVKLVTRAVPAGAFLLLTTRDQPVAAAANCHLVELDVLDTASARDLLDLHAGCEVRQVDDHSAQELIKLVGNLPLAIELLGKQIGGMRRKPGFSLKTLVLELRKERLNRLNLPGHPALIAIFALSYRSLGDAEKRCFRYLGVFSATVIPAVHLAEIIQLSPQLLEGLLDHLVGSSLLNWAEQAGVYRIHPLLREYSVDLLGRKKAEAQRARGAHLSYFASLGLKHGKQTASRIWEQHLPEIIHGVSAAGLQYPEIVLNLANALWIEGSLLATRGYYRESVVLLEAAAIAAKRLGRGAEAAAHIGNLGNAYSVLGDNVKAKQCYHRAVAMVDALADQFDRPAFVANLGLLLKQEGDWQGAFECFEEALEDALAVENLDVALDQFNNLGTMFRRRDPARAHQYYKLGIDLANKLGDIRLRATLLSNVGLLHFDAGEFKDAEKCIAEALELARRIGDRQSEANRLGHLGNVALAKGDHSEAIRLFEAAVVINREIGYKSREAEWLSNLGMALWRTGDKTTGMAFVREALQLSIGSRHMEAQGLNHLRLAGMISDSGDAGAAAQHLAEAHKILGGSQYPSTHTEF